MHKEINKFLRKISAEKLKNNHKECIELYNIVGGMYTDTGSYHEAIHYHEQALKLCRTIGDRLGTAVAFRYIGEAKATLGLFQSAIDYIKKYLDLAQKINDRVEVQRAYTTLGRVYLMQAQDTKENNRAIDEKTKDAAREAEKRFQTALNLADSVKEKVEPKEFAAMRSGLYINIGLIKDILGQHHESVSKIAKAIEICKSAKIKEDLYRCQIILTGIFRQRDNIKMAVRISEEALGTARSIGKKLLICDALLEKGMIKILQRDFKVAKRTFAQAYLEKSPNEDDHLKAIKMTKLSHLMWETYDKIAKEDNSSETRLKLCDKLGDLFVAIECYKPAIEFYKRAFTDAKLCSRPRSELARILFSIAETCADDGQFERAITCYQKEIEIRNGNDKDHCQTLIKIAHMKENLNLREDEVCQVYEDALAKAGKDCRMIYNVLKDYVPYLKRSGAKPTRSRELDDMLLNIKSYPEVIEEIETEDNEEVVDLEDEITNIEDIITDDENDDEVLMIGRRRARGPKRFKPNEVGDTPLHEACIKGDLKRVKSLLEQGHEVNPRDNAGWIPLHEACNHGYYEIAEHLIDNGADVSNRGLKGMSPLHDAATNGHYDIMRLLIKSGANVIALTDSGETVLSCLRDYRKRNYQHMSNQDQTEYKAIESELLNIMDRRGFNLMEATVKAAGSTATNQTAPVHQVLRNESRAPTSSSNNTNKGVSFVIPEDNNRSNRIPGSRPKDDQFREATRGRDLPATFTTNLPSTSLPTKDWLVPEGPIPDGDDDEEDIDDDRFVGGNEDIDIFGDIKKLTEMRSKSKSATSYKRKRPNSPEVIQLVADVDNDNEEDLSLEDIGARETPSCRLNFSSDEEFDLELGERDPDSDVNTTSERQITSARTSSRTSTSLDRPPVISCKVVSVIIDHDVKLIIPIKDPNSVTIGWLKETILERFGATNDGLRPAISLSLIRSATNSDRVPPKHLCQLFDQDLCGDVILGDADQVSVLATIESWNLDSMDQVYERTCKKLNLEPLDHIRMELRRLEPSISGNKLNLTFCRIPREHEAPLAAALTRRDFISANFEGFSSIFENSNDNWLLSRSSIGSWRQLRHLSLRSVGLTRRQLLAAIGAEAGCGIEGGYQDAASPGWLQRLSKLESLDLSYNMLARKCKGCPELEASFLASDSLAKLQSLLPNLKRLELDH